MLDFQQRVARLIQQFASISSGGIRFVNTTFLDSKVEEVEFPSPTLIEPESPHSREDKDIPGA